MPQAKAPVESNAQSQEQDENKTSLGERQRKAGGASNGEWRSPDMGLEKRRAWLGC